MNHFIEELMSVTLGNTDFRRVLYTAPHQQLVVMSLPPGEDIGTETHPETDQWFHVEAGRGAAVMGGMMHLIGPHVAFLVPAGEKHNVINTSRDEALKLYTIYSPPQHPDGTVHPTKAAALAAAAR